MQTPRDPSSCFPPSRFCHLLEAIRRGLSLCKFYSWKLGCGLEISSMLQSRDKAWVSSMAVTTGDACAYVADQDGSVPVYDVEEYGLQGPEPQPPRSRCDVLAGPYQHGDIPWGISPLLYLISLELREEEKFLLSSSLDRTVHLWSTDGEYIGKHCPTWPAAQSWFRASGGASIGSWIL
ncbi:hypothetical protein EI555_012247 [Monodon monoceros]|uniref:Uncharacterized protein n=1 Tax=Monodon monoceros TaxID=40151 RepID=A0A4U1EEN4_MONMO|nr:hypothetical protein EI555_012247 [Monodon monoceros]